MSTKHDMKLYFMQNEPVYLILPSIKYVRKIDGTFNKVLKYDYDQNSIFFNFQTSIFLPYSET